MDMHDRFSRVTRYAVDCNLGGFSMDQSAAGLAFPLWSICNVDDWAASVSAARLATSIESR